MGNISLQLQFTTGGSIANGSSVPFDDVVLYSGAIAYDSTLGAISLGEPGRYIINWWVATQATLATSGAVFTLVNSSGEDISSASIIKAGQLCGSAIIQVDTAPAEITLINNSGATYYLPTSLPVCAGLNLLQDTATELDIECFAQQQYANLVEQLITYYPATAATLFMERQASISNAVPFSVYTPTGMDDPGLVTFQQGTNYINTQIPFITAISMSTVAYNDDITYLPPPSPMPDTCAASRLTSLRNIAPVGSSVTIATGPTTNASGTVIANEIGVIVLGDASTPPLAPIFLYSPQIRYIVTGAPPTP